jgi:hypothetical protein
VEPDADRDGLRRSALEKKLRTQKWMSLRKAERSSTAPDQVALTSEERSHWLKNLYAEALAKGEIAPPHGGTNQQSTAPGQPPAAGAGVRPGVTALLTQSQPREVEKGATVLMEHAKSSTFPPPGVVANVPKPGRAAVSDAVEQVLLDNIAISDSDFRALAAERSKAVREYILKSGKVEAERLFLAENSSGGVKSEGSRVYLQLR